MKQATPTIVPVVPRRRAVTLRAVLLGTLCVTLLCALLPYNDFVVANTFLVGSYLPLMTVLALFVLVVLVNAPLHRFAPDRALSTGELATILTMCLVGSSVPGQGLMRTFLPSLVAPFYFGQSNASFWRGFVEMGLPGWLFPVESIAEGRGSSAAQEFYGRTPTDAAMPLAAWIVPLLGWGVFGVGLLGTFVALAFLFRVQWGTNERLAFPLAQLQLSLIEAPERGRGLNRLFRSRSFWIACGAVLFIHSLTALNAYFPRHVPKVPLNYDFVAMLADPPWNLLPWDVKNAKLYFTFIGIAYFIQSRTAFSLWSIWVLCQFLTMGSRLAGTDIPHPAWRDQHFGACVVFLAGIIWLGRGYWASVARSFVSSPAREDHDLRQVRTAAASAFAGIVLMLGWLWFVGVGLSAALLIVGIILMAHVTTARIVAETGMPFIRTIAAPQQVLVNVPTSSVRGPSAFMAMFANANGVSTARESTLTFAQHAVRVGEGADVVPRESRRIVAVIVWTLLLACAVSSVSSLHTYYSYTQPLGTGERFFENKYGLETQPEETVVKPLAGWAEGKWPPQPHTPWKHFATGATVCAALQLLTWRFAWWPFVPVGYLAAAPYIVNAAWFSIMVGWLAKVLIVRFGGAKLYQQSQSLFIGLIFGEALAAGVWLVVNFTLASLGYDYYPVQFLPT